MWSTQLTCRERYSLVEADKGAWNAVLKFIVSSDNTSRPIHPSWLSRRPYTPGEEYRQLIAAFEKKNGRAASPRLSFTFPPLPSLLWSQQSPGFHSLSLYPAPNQGTEEEIELQWNFHGNRFSIMPSPITLLWQFVRGELNMIWFRLWSWSHWSFNQCQITLSADLHLNRALALDHFVFRLLFQTLRPE